MKDRHQINLDDESFELLVGYACGLSMSKAIKKLLRKKK